MGLNLKLFLVKLTYFRHLFFSLSPLNPPLNIHSVSVKNLIYKKMPQLTKLISMEEASLHNSKDDCWLVIDNKVYDVSSYLDDHPGGDDIVLAATGKDASEEFEDAGHTKSAKELMETFFIGELDTSIAEPDAVSDKKLYAAKFEEFTKQYWVIPAAVLGVSVIVGFLHLRKK